MAGHQSSDPSTTRSPAQHLLGPALRSQSSDPSTTDAEGRATDAECLLTDAEGKVTDAETIVSVRPARHRGDQAQDAPMSSTSSEEQPDYLLLDILQHVPSDKAARLLSCLSKRERALEEVLRRNRELADHCERLSFSQALPQLQAKVERSSDRDRSTEATRDCGARSPSCSRGGSSSTPAAKGPAPFENTLQRLETDHQVLAALVLHINSRCMGAHAPSSGGSHGWPLHDVALDGQASQTCGSPDPPEAPLTPRMRADPAMLGVAGPVPRKEHGYAHRVPDLAGLRKEHSWPQRVGALEAKLAAAQRVGGALGAQLAAACGATAGLADPMPDPGGLGVARSILRKEHSWARRVGALEAQLAQAQADERRGAHGGAYRWPVSAHSSPRAVRRRMPASPMAAAGPAHVRHRAPMSASSGASLSPRASSSIASLLGDSPTTASISSPRASSAKVGQLIRTKKKFEGWRHQESATEREGAPLRPPQPARARSLPAASSSARARSLPAACCGAPTPPQLSARVARGLADLLRISAGAASVWEATGRLLNGGTRSDEDGASDGDCSDCSSSSSSCSSTSS